MTEEHTTQTPEEDENETTSEPVAEPEALDEDAVETSEEETSEDAAGESEDADSEDTDDADSFDDSLDDSSDDGDSDDDDDVAFLDEDDDDAVDASLVQELNDKIEELTSSLDEAKQEARQFKDRMMRGAADYENFRKRSTRDREEAVARAQEKVLVEILPVIDNLERALQHIPEGEDPQGTVVQGVQMVLRQFQGQLQKFGVVGFDSVGEPFNPELHEAIQQRDTDEHPNNTVVESYQRGYKIKEKLLRPAMVVVAKNPNG